MSSSSGRSNVDAGDKIPFNRPFIVGKELFYISQAVMSGHLAGGGAFTRRCERWMEERFGAVRVMLTNSCTAALEMAAILSGVEAGDEVIMPSYAYISTAGAFASRGASLRFVDIRPDTLNIDESLVEAAVSPRTRAIVPVHYAGVGCDMAGILEVAGKHGIMVIEDAAQAVNATIDGSYLGTLGKLGAYSFHETKNFICGEGGALVINDEHYIERAEVIREKGANRAQFFRGETDHYTWVDVGSSYLPSELTAAFLFAQLEAADLITTKRHQIFSYYARKLSPLQERGWIRLPQVPKGCAHNAHMFYILLQRADLRVEFIDHLRSRGIGAVFHFVPLHTSPMGSKMGCRVGDLPVTEDISSRVLRLPCYFELTRTRQDRVIEAIGDFFERPQH